MLDELRAIGLAMESIDSGRHHREADGKGCAKVRVGWTTDPEKADKARALGACVTTASDHGRLIGYEVSIAA